MTCLSLLPLNLFNLENNLELRFTKSTQFILSSKHKTNLSAMLFMLAVHRMKSSKFKFFKSLGASKFG